MAGYDASETHEIEEEAREKADFEFAEGLDSEVLYWTARRCERAERLTLEFLDQQCETEEERYVLHCLINRVAFLGGLPFAPDVFGVDVVSPRIRGIDLA